MNAEQRAELIAGIKNTLDVRLKDIENLPGRLLSLEQFVAELGAGPTGGNLLLGGNPSGAAGALRLMTKGRENELTTLANQRGKITLMAPGPVSLRAIVGDQGGNSPAGGFPVQPFRDPKIVSDPLRPLTLLQVLPVQTQNVGNIYEYVRMEPTDSPGEDYNAAEQVNEGDLKAEGHFTFTPEQAPIKTIALWARASRQVLSDVAQLLTELQGIFLHAVSSKFERTVAANLVANATPFVGASGDIAERISAALAALEVRGFVAPVVLMSPYTWSQLQTSKAVGGSETYLAGSWALPSPATVWGRPVVRNSAIPSNVVIIVDITAAKIIDRQQPAFMISTEDQDNFVRNMMTILAEIRAGLAITQPLGVVSLDLTESG